MSHRKLSGMLLVALTSTALPQQSQDAPRLTFDVAAIRPSEPGQTRGGIKGLPGGNGYVAKNVPVKLMISLMYRVPMSEIKGGPDWIETVPYDVDAKVEADHPYTLEQLHTMYQNLLTDRFNLKFHWETKEGPVYALTLDPAGLKMKPNNTPEDFQIPLTGSAGHITGTRVSMKYLCWWLGQILADDNRPVINKTGLADTDNFNFTLSFSQPALAAAPENPTPDLPSIFDAVREQLGLRLSAQKGPVQQLVIDHIDRPTGN
jgi:uncharacterized protein (TIGR03435 family)